MGHDQQPGPGGCADGSGWGGGVPELVVAVQALGAAAVVASGASMVTLHPQHHRPAHARRRRRQRRSDPAHADRARHRRAHPPVGRAVDPDHRAARQRARHRRAVDPAPGRRPHPGAGARPAGSARGSRNCSARPPSSTFRMVDQTDAGRNRRCRAACRRNPKFSTSSKAETKHALSDREARPGVGRGPDRRAARLRPAHQRADRHLPLQHQRRAQFAQVTQENVGRPFAIVLDNEVISAPVIREPILGGSGQISGSFTVAERQRPRHPAARRRAAGAADHHRGAHRRPGPRPGLDREGQASRPTSARRWSIVFMFATYGLFGAVRQHRGRDQRRDDLRRAVAAQRDADAARHRRHRAHRRHRGRLQRADLRAHPRGGARRPHADHRDRRRLHARACDHSRFQHHHLHRRRGAVLSSAPARCAALP